MLSCLSSWLFYSVEKFQMKKIKNGIFKLSSALVHIFVLAYFNRKSSLCCHQLAAFFQKNIEECCVYSSNLFVREYTEVILYDLAKLMFV